MFYIEVVKVQKSELSGDCGVLSVPIFNIHSLDVLDQHRNESLYFTTNLEIIKSIIRTYSNIEAFILLGNKSHPDYQATYDITFKAVKKVRKSIRIYQDLLYRAVVGETVLKKNLHLKC